MRERGAETFCFSCWSWAASCVVLTWSICSWTTQSPSPTTRPSSTTHYCSGSCYCCVTADPHRAQWCCCVSDTFWRAAPSTSRGRESPMPARNTTISPLNSSCPIRVYSHLTPRLEHCCWLTCVCVYIYIYLNNSVKYINSKKDSLCFVVTILLFVLTLSYNIVIIINNLFGLSQHIVT